MIVYGAIRLITSCLNGQKTVGFCSFLANSSQLSISAYCGVSSIGVFTILNQNHARPLFRLLFGVLACFFWYFLYFVGSTFTTMVEGDLFFLIVSIGICVFLIWVGFLSTFVAFNGRLPIKTKQ